MTVTYEWLEQQAILVLNVSGNWLWEEFHEASVGYSQITDNLDQRFDILIDFTEASAKIPTAGFANIASLSKRGEATGHWGIAAMVMPFTVYRSVMQMFARLYPRLGTHFVIVKTVADAHEAIRQKRSEDAKDTIE